MTLYSKADLLDHTPVDVRSIWAFNQGTPGTLSDSAGWELQEFWVVGWPRLSLEERKHVESQLTAPDLP